MNILAVDTSTQRLEVAIYDGLKITTHTYEPLPHQSEELLPIIDSLLKDAALKISDIKCFSIAAGPGSFTSLRLGYAAVKAFSLASNGVIYAVPTLDLYLPKNTPPYPVISVMDARGGLYFSKVIYNGAVLLDTKIYTKSEILSVLKKDTAVAICGPSAKMFFDEVNDNNVQFFLLDAQSTSKALIEKARDMFTNGEPGLKDFDAPLYYSESSAQLNYKQS